MYLVLNMEVFYGYLILNYDKSEVIVLGPKHVRSRLSYNILSLDGITLSSSSTERNLGVIFDQDLSYIPHITQVSRMSELCNCQPAAGPER